jgi:hypothetical protein
MLLDSNFRLYLKFHEFLDYHIIDFLVTISIITSTRDALEQSQHIVY